MSKKHRGEWYVNQAEENGLRTRSGKGSHTVVYGPVETEYDDGGRPFMTIPHGDLATGTEHAIQKWFKRIGILFVLIWAAVGVGLYLGF